MLPLSTYLTVAGILLVTTSVGAAIGFGMGVLALPFVCLFVEIKLTPPFLGLLGLCVSSYLAFKDRHFIDKGQFVKILGWCALGFPIGNWGYHALRIDYLNFLLGVFIVIVAIKALLQLCLGKELKPWSPTSGRTLLILGGIIHGAFTTGGPAVVAYAEREISDKTRFRATLLTLWATLNSVFLLVYFLRPGADYEVLRLAAFAGPSVIIGIIVGQKLHHALSDSLFKKFVFVLLLIGGLSRLVPDRFTDFLIGIHSGDNKPTVTTIEKDLPNEL